MVNRMVFPAVAGCLVPSRLMTEREPGSPWAEPSRSLPELAGVRLDELLHELLDRVGAVTAMQERLRVLLDAVVSIATDLELPSVLERIVRAACRLAGARYGALGVLGPDRRLSEFITYGLTDEQRAKIGDLPSGHGVLGLLIESPEPLRMPMIGAHPRSYGFPPNHPMMNSFLGVPIRIQDRVFGNLYLAEKHGAAEFDQDDEDFVVALAAAAGVAIENARLYELSEQRQRWLEAGTEISNVMLGNSDRDTALQLVAAKAREVSDSALAVLALYGDDGELRLSVADGDPLPHLEGRPLHVGGTLLESVLTGKPAVLEDVQKEDGAAVLREAGVGAASELGPAVIVPLRSSDRMLGVLVLVAHRDLRAPYTDQDVQVALSFAAQAGLALARASALRDRELLAVLGDRDRIARDLHDVVIQRLFAAGLSLQTAARLAVRPEVRQTVDGAVDVIDGVIRDIREAIFELHHPDESIRFRTELRDVVDAAADQLGFAPQLRLDGPLEAALRGQLRTHVLAVVRELLSNSARHSESGRVEVEIAATGRRLRVTVTDDGVGVGGIERRSGLANLNRRAQELGGSFEIWPGHPKGTVAEWRVPLRGEGLDT